VLLLSASPLANPCGALLTRWNMNPAQPAGELLVAAPLVALGGVTWGGVGQPAAFTLLVPGTPLLLGQSLFAQGVIVDPLPPAPPFGLSEALRLTVGL
jgi:hypothetical protein